MVLATKVGLPFGEDPNHRGASRRWITQAVENSLRRLDTDWIDLYQVHRLDPNTDIDETLGVLSDLVHAGKIRAFGASTVPASQIVEAQWAAERRGRERFRTEQPQYSILDRGVESDVLPTAALRDGRADLQPARGRLALRQLPQGPGRGRAGSAAAASASRRCTTSLPGQRRQARRRRRPRHARRRDRHHLDPAGDRVRVRHPAVTSAIVGPRTMEHLESYLAADGVELSAEVLDRIDEIVPPGREH